MNDSIENLVERWKQNPSAATTVALCEALCDSPRGPLIEQVGELASRRHAGDVTVLLSVVRMYVESGRLADAQSVLVAAGKGSPNDSRVLRWLGEVLLRRGDARRAEKVLGQAIRLGSRDTATRLWLERARGFLHLQAQEGENAVAAEVSEATAMIDRDPSEPSFSSLQTRPGAFFPVASLEHRSGANGHRVSSPPRKAEELEGGGERAWVPHPRDVLDALALAGLFETGPGRGAAWDRAAPGPKRKGTAALVVMMVLFLGGCVSTFVFYRHRRAEHHVLAEAILTGVEAQLHDGRPATLTGAEQDLARAFRLESRSARAALDWTRERAIVGLVAAGSDVAFEDAMARAKELGVPEDQYAFAQVASFLSQGDTAGAAGVLPRWDGPAAGDAWYQLVAGAALERAGDDRARNRYAAAVELDPELFVARIALARATAFQAAGDQAAPMARQLRAKFPDRAEPVALVALAWGRDPMREAVPVPPEVDAIAPRIDELPSGLKFVPHAVSALREIDRHAIDEARGEVSTGLSVCESPGAAVWLGAIALRLGDEALARKAAVLALQFSAVYEPARALAARVALAAGRLDEALKATEELDAASPDVAVVRSAAAYERLDSDGIALALGALSLEEHKLPSFAALTRASGVMAGRSGIEGTALTSLASDDAPWGDLVAMDAALDSGELSTADKIAALWGRDSESRPLRALRLARLARYEGRLDAADTLSQVALDHAAVTPRVLWERAFELVARGRAGEVGPLLARFPLALGPMGSWLNAYAIASGGNVDAAKGKTAMLDPPPDTAPFDIRVVASAALGAMKDKRRGVDYVKDVLSAGSPHPDLVAAALSLGLHPVSRGRRRPTYE